MALEKKRVSSIQQAKGHQSSAGLCRKPFSEPAKAYQEGRRVDVAERTMQFEKERLLPLCAAFGEKPCFVSRRKTSLRISTRGLRGHLRTHREHGDRSPETNA